MRQFSNWTMMRKFHQFSLHIFAYRVVSIWHESWLWTKPRIVQFGQTMGTEKYMGFLPLGGGWRCLSPLPPGHSSTLFKNNRRLMWGRWRRRWMRLPVIWVSTSGLPRIVFGGWIVGFTAINDGCSDGDEIGFSKFHRFLCLLPPPLFSDPPLACLAALFISCRLLFCSSSQLCFFSNGSAGLVVLGLPVLLPNGEADLTGLGAWPAASRQYIL